MLFGELESGESYLHHYTSPRGLADILEGGSIWLSSYLGTNDPLETRAWRVQLERDGWNHQEDWPSLTVDVRQRVKIGCFTLDASNTDGQTSWLLNRGWARARMWSQYASSHSGACLVFDKNELDNEFEDLLQRGAAFGRHGAVHYSNTTFANDTLLLSADELETRSESVVIQELIEAKCEEIFFKKNLDWATESEYRYLVTSDAEYEQLPVGKALVGIVVGQEFPNSELKVLLNRLVRFGRSDLPVTRLDWVDGRPDVRFDLKTGIQLEQLDLQAI